MVMFDLFSSKIIVLQTLLPVLYLYQVYSCKISAKINRSISSRVKQNMI